MTSRWLLIHIVYDARNHEPKFFFFFSVVTTCYVVVFVSVIGLRAIETALKKIN
jgi:hypothetical protein